MEAKTFLLLKTKTWSRQVRVFIMNRNKKYDDELLTFTTEHVVSSKQRNTRGHMVPAQYTTTDQKIYDALLRDSAYGKDFILRGDPEGKLKQPTIVIDENDRDIIALRGLFRIANLPMDETLPYDVLKKQYEIHMVSVAGAKPEANVTIPHVQVDVKANIEQAIAQAKQKYEDDYGEPIPAIVENDLAFLDGLSNPAFDAQQYIDNKIAQATKVDAPTETEKATIEAPSKEDLHAKYFAKFQKNVPNLKVNDLKWIETKLAE